MNIKKFGKRLSKINMLFNSIKEDGEVSAIEKDLLLSYMREAYEYIVDSDNTAKATKTSSKRYAEPDHHVPPPQASSKSNVLQQIASDEVAPVVEMPRVAAATPDQSQPAPTPTPDHSMDDSSISVDPALLEIFQNAEVSELSDRLSMSAIKDMNRAMGINERIFTVKELFGGDTEIFNSVLTAINDCKSYEEAKDYLLTGIAKDQDWSNGDRIKKAEHFVKLVKRRFV